MLMSASPSAPDLPRPVRLAADLAGLNKFLENAAPGLHWWIVEHLEDGLYLVDRDRRIIYWSAGAERITGYSAAEVLGARCADNILRHVEADGRCLCEDACPLAAVMQDGRPRSADVFLLHKLGYRVPVHVYGAPVYDRRGNILGAFETFADRTHHLAAIERMQVLEQAAYLDALTGLPNRRYLEQALETSLGQMQRTGPAFGVILGDVDHFKRFNDTYGHPTGDRVLQVVAQTLLRACRTYDVAGRWGGEEFLVVAGHGTVEGVRTAAERLRALVAQAEVTDGGRRLAVTMSFGATLARAGDDARSVVARADALLYQSKSTGRNRVSFEA